MDNFEHTNFSSLDIPISTCLHIIYMWIFKWRTEDIEYETNVPIKDIFRIMFQLIKKDNLETHKKKLGGPNSSVQVDDAVIINCKLFTDSLDIIKKT